MEIGYIKIWRKIREGNLWPKKKYTKLERWLDLLLSANGVDGVWQGIEIKRGSFITSQRKLSDRWGISLGCVSKFINTLKSERRIELNPYHDFTHIIILKYEDFNPINELKNERKVNAKETQSETTNEYNEIKEIKKDTTIDIVGGKPQSDLQTLIDYSKQLNFPLQGTVKLNRYSASNLLKKFGLEKSKWLVSAATNCRGKPYSPTINDFMQLYRKVGDLITYYKKGQNGQNRIGKI